MEKKEKKKNLSKFILKNFFLKKKNSKNYYFFLFSKNQPITSLILNHNVYIYNGNVFRILNLNLFFLCLKFGCFVFTRKPFKFLLKKKKR